MLATIDWTNVLVALIAGLPAIIAAIGTLHIRNQIRTPSGTSIGRQVEDVNHTTRSNWHSIDAIRKDVGIEASPEASREVETVEGLNGE